MNSVFSERSKLIATCSTPRVLPSGEIRKVNAQPCSRGISSNEVSVDYDFSEDLIGETELLDRIIDDTLRVWRCPAK